MGKSIKILLFFDSLEASLATTRDRSPGLSNRSSESVQQDFTFGFQLA